MNRLWIVPCIVGCFFLFSAQAEDTGSSSTPEGGETPASAPAPASPSDAAATPVTMPGTYGSAPITVTPGQGRFAKPPYDFTLTLLQGYDDNIFTTPTHFDIRTGTRPKTASLTNSVQLGMQIQAATPRTVFTLDAALGAVYYWHRPGVKQEDYNGSLSFLFFHRINPRLNISANGSIAYLSQPNFSALNAPTTTQTGDYILGNGRTNVSYQWGARLQTNTSYSLDATLYQSPIQKGNNVYTNTFGNEIRYLASPRAALIVEGRYATASYQSNPAGASKSAYLLLGADYSFSSRLSATLRAGEQIRTFDMGTVSFTSTTGSGGTIITGTSKSSIPETSPYLETTLTYIYGHQSQLQWTNRFGLEASNNSSEKSSSFRTGINVNHVLTAKLTALVGLNLNHLTTTSPDIIAGFNLGERVATQNQVNCVLGLQYMVTPKFSLSLNYTFTDVMSSTRNSNPLDKQTFPDPSYIRNQFSFGGMYTF